MSNCVFHNDFQEIHVHWQNPGLKEVNGDVGVSIFKIPRDADQSNAALNQRAHLLLFLVCKISSHPNFQKYPTFYIPKVLKGKAHLTST